MLTDERPPVGDMRSSSSTGRSRPPWPLTVDELPSTVFAASASARFAVEDLVSPSSGRGTGAFLPCVQMQSPPLSQPVPRPGVKAAAKPRNNSATNKKKPRPSPSTPKCGGGPGMHVVFIDPSSRPSGTGVFLPRSTAADPLRLHQHHHAHGQQQQQQPPPPPSQHKKPPASSSPVLLPARVLHLLNQRTTKLEAPAAAAGTPHLGPPHQVSAVLLKGDKIQDEHQQQQNRGEGGKRGTDAAATAAYDDVAGDYRDHASTTKCAVPPMQDYSASTLIEKLLPEEWSY